MADREQRCILQIGKVRQCDIPLLHPFSDRHSHPNGRFLIPCTLKQVIIAIRTSHIIVFLPRNDIQTDSGRQLDMPIIHRHTRNHMMVIQDPVRAYHTILNPDIGIGSRKRFTDYRILDKHGRMGLYLTLHDNTLVSH